MGLLDFLSGGGNSGPAPDLYAGALTPEQMAAMRQRSLGGAMAGLLKSGALDYTVPFISGKVPGGFAAGLAGAAAGAQDAQDQSANVGMKAQEFLLNRQKQQALLAGLQEYMKLGEALRNGGDAAPAAGGATPPEAGGAQPMGDTAGDTGGGSPSDPRGLVPFIKLTAMKYGVDPGLAVKVAASEGLGTFLGDHGKSGGAFQLYTGGGEGNNFIKETGLDPLDPKNERATIDFALRRVAENGWGPWNGAKALGITGMMGVDPSKALGNAPQRSLAGTAAAVANLQPGQPQGASLAYGGTDYPAPPGSPADKQSQADARVRTPHFGLSQAFAQARGAGFNGTIQDFLRNGPAPAGAAPQGMPAADTGMPPGGPPSPGAPLGTTPNLGLPIRGPMSMPGQPSPGATPVPPIANNTNAPPPPMPAGLIPGAGAPPPPSGIPPVTQPQPIPAAQQQGAAPAQMPAVPSAALTPAQLLQAKIAQAQANIASYIGIKPPGYAEEYSKLPLVGPQAAAKANAELPAQLYLKNNSPTNVRSGILVNPATGRVMAAAPQPIDRQLDDGRTERGFVIPGINGQPPQTQWTGVYTKQSPQATSRQETVGRAQGEATPVPIGPQADASALPGQPGTTGETPAIQGSPLAPGLSSAIPTYKEPAYTSDELKSHGEWAKTTDAMAVASGKAQIGERRLMDIAHAFQMIQTGSFTQQKGEWNSVLKAIGGPTWLQFSNADPGAIETALHAQYMATLQSLGAVNTRFTQREFVGLSNNSEHPNLQPDANLKMLSEDIGSLRQIKAMSNDWANVRTMPNSPYHDPDIFRLKWLNQNQINPVADAISKEIGVGKLAPEANAPAQPGQPKASGVTSSGMRWRVQ